MMPAGLQADAAHALLPAGYLIAHTGGRNSNSIQYASAMRVLQSPCSIQSAADAMTPLASNRLFTGRLRTFTRPFQTNKEGSVASLCFEVMNAHALTMALLMSAASAWPHMPPFSGTRTARSPETLTRANRA